MTPKRVFYADSKTTANQSTIPSGSDNIQTKQAIDIYPLNDGIKIQVI